MKFLRGVLVFVLLAIIIGGVGYIGYSVLFGNHSGHNTASTDTNGTDTTQNNNQNMQHGTQGMQDSSPSSHSQNNNSQQPANSQIVMNQTNVILQNKEKLDQAITLINESQRLMSPDPYSPGSSVSGNMSGMNSVQPQQPVQVNPPAAANPGNNTVINIYPQAGSSNTQPGAMQNMGTTYDPAKMEQLHSGLYKIAVGNALLDQLKNELVYQAEYAGMNAQDPIQYYSYQYNLTVQNKNKLNQALTYINEAVNLVNINPYISANGLVYDKERMGQLHQSILKFAEGVAALNQLSDSFTKQTISLSVTVQNYINNANNMSSHSNMSTGLFGNLFSSISLSGIVNIILILFIAGLIFGIFGFVFSLLKPSQKSNGSNANNVNV